MNDHEQRLTEIKAYWTPIDGACLFNTQCGDVRFLLDLVEQRGDEYLHKVAEMQLEKEALQAVVERTVKVMEHAKKHGHIGFQKIENPDGTWHDWRDDFDRELEQAKSALTDKEVGA